LKIGLPISRLSPRRSSEPFLDDLYQPLGGADAIDAAIAETEGIVRAAEACDAPATAALLSDIESGPLPEHRRRVLDTALRVLADVDALTPALWAALLETRLPAEELLAFRVMRDDFDVLKSRCQDIFELGSRTLAMIAPFANIARRGDVRAFADGQRRTQQDALRARAAVREGWLVDLPAVKVLYDAVGRRTRGAVKQEGCSGSAKGDGELIKETAPHPDVRVLGLLADLRDGHSTDAGARFAEQCGSGRRLDGRR
jgi:hypothetical protein